jgi:diguanylate cyclase (GGDEF)-like protein
MSGNVSARAASRTLPLERYQRVVDAERAEMDADRDAADADQTTSDVDQTLADRDSEDAERDQLAAELDQALADEARRLLPGSPDADAGSEARAQREASRISRLESHLTRSEATDARLRAAAARDATAASRDERAKARDRRAEDLERELAAVDSTLAAKLRRLRVAVAADRERAAADRERAAAERAAAARERERLEAELHVAYIDDLTGTFRRELGALALKLEVKRARRGNGQLVIAFVDVDGLKGVNDRSGHEAGDHVLHTLATTLRANLRSFDPIVRHGGDEFVCGIGGVSLEDAERRFELIDRALQDEVGVGVSVGLAALAEGETLEQVTARADAQLLEAKNGRVH